ncbi:hypothetical protein NBRC116594_05240 [Shimia sp. NS0008-38b]|uniref:hypothetical protein n=1 Tax=Shimia sp. NS0008-38b TaxID=3127653 RepID=UPI0031088574
MQHALSLKSAFALPRQTFPAQVQAFVDEQYTSHDIILEYGSGGSTFLAASQIHSQVMSVENDRSWAENMRHGLQTHFPDAPVHLHYVDTGPTNKWGRPTADQTFEQWRNFPKYALDIWDQPFFKHPDLILIDGRFRPACLLATMMRIERPVTVLFDDYVNRDRYHWIERFAKPTHTISRMAKFDLVPTQWSKGELTKIVLAFSDCY